MYGLFEFHKKGLGLVLTHVQDKCNFDVFSILVIIGGQLPVNNIQQQIFLGPSSSLLSLKESRMAQVFG